VEKNTVRISQRAAYRDGLPTRRRAKARRYGVGTTPSRNLGRDEDRCYRAGPLSSSLSHHLQVIAGSDEWWAYDRYPLIFATVKIGVGPLTVANRRNGESARNPRFMGLRVDSAWRELRHRRSL